MSWPAHGAVAARIRSHNWSASVGAPCSWPTVRGPPWTWPGDGTWDWALAAQHVVYSARAREILQSGPDPQPDSEDFTTQHLRPDDRDTLRAEIAACLHAENIVPHRIPGAHAGRRLALPCCAPPVAYQVAYAVDRVRHHEGHQLHAQSVAGTVYYCDDGLAEIDNNVAQNALRTCCLGRENCLFIGADRGSERAATMYSLIVSAKLNGVDPQAYLRHVPTHIADYPVNQVADLLPWNVAGQLR